MAKAILEAARAHNAKRLARSGNEQDDDASESLPQEPVTTWRKLPRTFAGFQFVDVEPDDVLDPEPCELPPSADIAYYTLDKTHPHFSADRRETYKDWSAIVMEWAGRNGRSLSRQHARIWAMLLAHRVPADDSAVPDLLNEEIRSPWKKGAIVKVRRLAEPEDDVPFC